ncbi:hypothetical protein FGO68_gene5081 [Halteria grandinella]|uniref:Uncharacterized protein n=1 Tax=Halteria grandinella TaxID=5974 RepID=A0A8J8SVM3_HALGN|nr:hypothetical protein FGO68_gene5081 [Halteria grandinella]
MVTESLNWSTGILLLILYQSAICFIKQLLQILSNLRLLLLPSSSTKPLTSALQIHSIAFLRASRSALCLILVLYLIISFLLVLYALLLLVLIQNRVFPLSSSSCHTLQFHLFASILQKLVFFVN